MTNKIELKA